MVDADRWQVRFFTIWGAQALSMFGTSLVQFALVWWLTQTTGSATVLALATLAAMAPNVLLGPLAGALVDRWNRRLVMIVADAAAALGVLALAALFAAGAVEIWHIYAATLLRATMQTFQLPAMQASTSLLVPQDQLTRVAGLNQMLQGLTMIAAPPLGALLLSLIAVQGVLLIDVVTALLGILPLFFLRIPQPRAAETASRTSVLGDMPPGLSYVFAWPGMLILLCMAAAINLVVVPAMALKPILVTEHFGGDVGGLALLEAAFGIGVIVGGVLLGVWGGFKRRIVTSLLGIALVGVGLIAVGLTPAGAFWAAVAATGGVGAMLVFANGPLMALMQATVAPEMQGRVFTLVASVSGAMAPLGLLLAGPAADRFGVQVSFLAGGAVCLLMAVAAGLTPAVMALEERGAPQAAAQAAGDEPPGVGAAQPR
jgi:DHA3 family macrolide efflux protein-like MFS transporter